VAEIARRFEEFVDIFENKGEQGHDIVAMLADRGSA
jgi:hypothetical protein